MIELKDLLLSKKTINYAVNKLDLFFDEECNNLMLELDNCSLLIDLNNNNYSIITLNEIHQFECFNKVKALKNTNYLENKTLIDNYCLKALYNKALTLNSDIENTIYKAFN